MNNTNTSFFVLGGLIVYRFNEYIHYEFLVICLSCSLDVLSIWDFTDTRTGMYLPRLFFNQIMY